MIAHAIRSIRLPILVAVMSSGVLACASQEPAYEPAGIRQAAAVRTPYRQTPGERAAAVALQQVGVPYRYGGMSPRGFDCSGLVHYSYARAGIAIPRTTTGLWNSLEPVSARQLQIGDLLFFDIKGKMSHVGLYLGGGRFVHAPSSGKVVAVENLNNAYYSEALIRAGRPE